MSYYEPVIFIPLSFSSSEDSSSAAPSLPRPSLLLSTLPLLAILLFTLLPTPTHAVSEPPPPPPSFTIPYHNPPPNPSTFYPYQESHESLWPDHLPWKYYTDAAFCLHYKPFSRPALHSPLRSAQHSPLHHNSTDFAPFLSENCAQFIHDTWIPEMPRVLHCGATTDPLPPNNEEVGGRGGEGNTTTLPDELAVYLGTHEWDDPEHCRAGCESCFDSMELFGAQGAVCRRTVGGAGFARTCGMGLFPMAATMQELPLQCPVKDTLDRAKEGMDWRRVGGDLRGNLACHLEWDRERWRELGYMNLTDAVESGREDGGEGDVRVYYVHGIEDVGESHGGKEGKKRVVKALLGGGGNQWKWDWGSVEATEKH